MKCSFYRLEFEKKKSVRCRSGCWTRKVIEKEEKVNVVKTGEVQVRLCSESVREVQWVERLSGSHAARFVGVESVILI